MGYDRELGDRQDEWLAQWLACRRDDGWDEEELEAAMAGHDYVLDNQDRFKEIGSDEAFDMGRCVMDDAVSARYWRRNGGAEGAADRIYDGIRAAQKMLREVGVQR